MQAETHADQPRPPPSLIRRCQVLASNLRQLAPGGLRCTPSQNWQILSPLATYGLLHTGPAGMPVGPWSKVLFGTNQLHTLGTHTYGGPASK